MSGLLGENCGKFDLNSSKFDADAYVAALLKVTLWLFFQSFNVYGLRITSLETLDIFVFLGMYASSTDGQRETNLQRDSTTRF